MSKDNIIGTNFIITNRDLIYKYGVNSAVMLGELYGRMKYFRERKELKIWILFCYERKHRKEYKIKSI